MLSGKLLDEAEIKCKAMLRDQIKLKYVVLSQDGWSDTRNEPVVAASIHCEGSTYPLDFISVGASEKNAEFMALKAKESILRAEEEFGCVVVGFVSDSENKMVRCRKVRYKINYTYLVYNMPLDTDFFTLLSTDLVRLARITYCVWMCSSCSESCRGQSNLPSDSGKDCSYPEVLQKSSQGCSTFERKKG